MVTINANFYRTHVELVKFDIFELEIRLSANKYLFTSYLFTSKIKINREICSWPNCLAEMKWLNEHKNYNPIVICACDCAYVLWFIPKRRRRGDVNIIQRNGWRTARTFRALWNVKWTVNYISALLDFFGILFGTTRQHHKWVHRCFVSYKYLPQRKRAFIITHKRLWQKEADSLATKLRKKFKPKSQSQTK